MISLKHKWRCLHCFRRILTIAKVILFTFFSLCAAILHLPPNTIHYDVGTCLDRCIMHMMSRLILKMIFLCVHYFVSLLLFTLSMPLEKCVLHAHAIVFVVATALNDAWFISTIWNERNVNVENSMLLSLDIPSQRAHDNHMNIP